MEQYEIYIVPAVILISGVIVARILGAILKNTVFRKSGILKKYLADFNGYFLPFLYLAAFFVAYQSSSFSAEVERIADYALKIAFTLLLIRLTTRLLRNSVRSYLDKHDETGTRFRQSRGIILIVNGVLWTIGLVFLFDNLGFNVTAVLTGLGVGGIAIALAAQTILGDLFNYFVIFFDQPFELGDFIIVDDKLGTVEYIGLKTTRIRSLQGEQIVFSNTNLTGSRIHNYKRMNERRILFKLGVVYDTPAEKLESIPEMIRSIIESQDDTRFDRCHFASFGDFSLTIETVYYILSSDYNRYMDIQEKINLTIHRKFKAAKIDFAFPTYSVEFRDAVEQPVGSLKNGDRFGRDH